jgi:hypothetical protein
VAEIEGGREAAVAQYFRWNADGLVQAISGLGSAAILLTFAMADRLADTGLGYRSPGIHLVLVGLAFALAAPVGLRERHAMLALRPIAGALALACLLVPTVGWRFIPPAPGVTAHLPGIVIGLAVAAFIPAACVTASTFGRHWQAFLAYCRAPSVWNGPHGGAA